MGSPVLETEVPCSEYGDLLNKKPPKKKGMESTHLMFLVTSIIKEHQAMEDYLSSSRGPPDTEEGEVPLNLASLQLFLEVAGLIPLSILNAWAGNFLRGSPCFLIYFIHQAKEQSCNMFPLSPYMNSGFIREMPLVTSDTIKLGISPFSMS